MRNLFFAIGFVVALSSMVKAETVKMEVTAYCPCKACCGPRAKGITADGSRAVGKLVAAPAPNPKTGTGYAFGTRMNIPGYGAAVVHDRGGAIKAKGVKLKKGMTVGKAVIPVRVLPLDRLDVLMPTHQKAQNWGKRIVLVEVLR